jgi:hypothetical protein
MKIKTFEKKAAEKAAAKYIYTYLKEFDVECEYHWLMEEAFIAGYEMAMKQISDKESETAE